ncbi:uncharacterized protein LOC135161093 isoform X2 [Diachasmimorpha longicaudata]|uniref:uncharacterized protein LOC135161093 isoform X2 n=1 Tax=Diachasmimorpha longicaudata TaxID=58733 RepID=UPI0030B8A3F6
MRKAKEPRMSTRKYSDEDLEKALTSIAAGMTTTVASRTYNIPKSTLDGHKKRKLYSAPTPADDLDKILVDWVIAMSDKGFPIIKDQVINSVQEFLQKMDKPNEGADQPIEEQWWLEFKTRNPEICDRITKNMMYTPETVTAENIRQWFHRHRAHLTSQQLLNIDPSRKFCCDESGFLLSPQGEKALVKRTENSAYNFANNHAKECVTALIGGNAVGQRLPILVMFNYHRLPTNIISTMPANYIIRRSESGWTTAQLFLDWMRHSFQPFLMKNKIQLPVVLYLDGHSPYFSVALNVGVFKPLEEVWRKVVTEWTVAHNGEGLNKKEFGGVFKTAVDQVDWRRTLRNGFCRTGLHSFDTDEINDEEQVQTSSQESLGTPGATVGLPPMPLVESAGTSQIEGGQRKSRKRSIQD